MKGVQTSKNESRPDGRPLFLEQGTGVDLRCGGGHLGLQGAPGALPRALGFDSHLDIKNKSRPDGRLLFLEQGTGVEPA